MLPTIMKKSKDSDFYKRMLEAKALKKKALEQKQLHDEFLTRPELYHAPGVPKTEAELSMDKAFNELKEKLQRENPTHLDRISEKFNQIERGL